MDAKPKAGLRCQAPLARAVANIQGASSVAAQALAEFKLRRAAGEDVIMFPLRGKWLVGLANEMRTESERVGALSREAGSAAERAIRARDGRVRQTANRMRMPRVRSVG